MSSCLKCSIEEIRRYNSFHEPYLGFLSGGCSADPITHPEYVRMGGAGVDMASPKPIEDATKLFDEMISEMEKILN